MPRLPPHPPSPAPRSPPALPPPKPGEDPIWDQNEDTLWHLTLAHLTGQATPDLLTNLTNRLILDPSPPAPPSRRLPDPGRP